MNGFRYMLGIVIVFSVAVGCSGVTSPECKPARPVYENENETEIKSTQHFGVKMAVLFDLETRALEIVSKRYTSAHIGTELDWVSGGTEFLEVEIIDFDKWEEVITLGFEFTNPLPVPIYDPRMIIYSGPYVQPVNPDAYTDYQPAVGNPINPFYAFAKDCKKRSLQHTEGASREIAIEYDSLTSLLNLDIYLDACLGGNAKEPYELTNITQRDRTLYVDALDWQNNVDEVRVSRVDDTEWNVKLNQINEEVTFSATLYFPVNPPAELMVSASSEGSPYSIYQYTDWEPGLLPMKFGRGIYAWTFYNPDTGVIPASYMVIYNQCKNKFGADWLIANMGHACYDGSIFYEEEFFWFLRDFKSVVPPDLPVMLNLGLLGFGPGEQDVCGGYFDGDWRRFFGDMEKSLLALNKKFELQDYVDGICLDFETLLAPQPMWYRREFMDSYGDFIARLKYYPEFEGLYIVPYNDALMPKELGYDYDALNHLKQGDFFLTAAFPTSYVWDADWWLELDPNAQYAHVPSAADYLKSTLDVYHDLAETVSTPFQPIVGFQGVWMDYHGDTLPHVQPCAWTYFANIDAWCFGHSTSFGSSDELDITRGRWLHKKEVERVIADVPSTDVDVLSKMGAVFYQLGDLDPDVPGDDIIWHRAPYSYQMVDEVIGGYDSPYCFDPVNFHWEVAQDYKMYAYNRKSETGFGAISGRISFDDGSKFVDHLGDFHQARVDVTGLPEGLPDYFYSTDIIGLDDGSYAFAGIPAGYTLTLQAFAGTYVSDPVVVEVKKKVHARGVDLVLHEE